MSNSLTVDLKGNNKKLNDTLKDSQGMVGAFGKAVQTAFYTIEVAQKALAAGGAIVNWAAGFIAAAAESQEAEEKLGAVLESTGHAAGFTKEQLVGLSAELQNVTKFEAETTQEAMGVIATFKNIRGDIFIEATKAAQDMATVLGTDLKGASMQLGKAINDPVAGMAALKRSGVSFTESQEEMINTLVKSGDVIGAQKMILAELSSEFGGAAEKVGNTFAGKMEIFKNRWGDIAEDIGFALMPIVEKLFPIAEGVADIMEQVVQPVLESFVDWAINTGQSVVASLGPTFQWIGETALTTFTAFETILFNFGNYWQLTIDTIALSMVKFVNDTVHFFTDTLPAAISWFADNAGNLLMDYFNFQKTLFMNMAKNIGDFMVATWSMIKGEGFNWEMTGLLDGFKSTIDKLPEFRERLQTDTEKILQSEIDRNAGIIGEQFNQRYAKNREVYENLFKAGKKELEDLENTANLDFDKKDFTTKDGAKDKKAKDAKAAKDGRDENKTAGGFVGLEEMGKRIAAAAASNDTKQLQKEAKDAMLKLVNENQHLIKALQDNAAALVNGDAARGAVDLIGAGVNRVKEFIGNVGKAEWQRKIDVQLAEIDAAAKQRADQHGLDFAAGQDALGMFDPQVAIDAQQAAMEAADKQLQEANKKDDGLLAALIELIGVNKEQKVEQQNLNKLLPMVGALK